MACHGRVQRKGEVPHVVTDHLQDLSDLLRNGATSTARFRSGTGAAMGIHIRVLAIRAEESMLGRAVGTSET